MQNILSVLYNAKQFTAQWRGHGGFKELKPSLCS